MVPSGCTVVCCKGVRVCMHVCMHAVRGCVCVRVL